MPPGDAARDGGGGPVHEPARLAVVHQEQLLERWFAADELVHVDGGERLQQWVHRPAHLAPDPPARDLDGIDAGHVVEAWRVVVVERDLDGHRREVPQLVHRALFDEPALAQDADPITQGLDLRQDVRGQEDRLPAVLRFVHGSAERLLHQRIQPRGRFVEHQHVGPRRERGDEHDLLAVALRVGTHLLAGVEVEPLHQQVAVRVVAGAVETGEEVQRLFAGERRPQRCLTRHVRQPAMDRDGVGSGVEAEHRGRAGGRADQAEEQPDGRRLACAIGSEEAVHLAFGSRRASGRPARRRTRTAC